MDGGLTECLVGVEVVILREVPDDRAASGVDGTRVGFELCAEDFEEGGLARAVATDEADALGGFDGEGCAVEDDMLAIGVLDVCGLEQRHRSTGYSIDRDGFTVMKMHHGIRAENPKVDFVFYHSFLIHSAMDYQFLQTAPFAPFFYRYVPVLPLDRE